MYRAFQGNSDMIHIPKKYVPVEAAHSTQILERYFQPLRHAFNIIAKEAPVLDIDDALQMAVNRLTIPLAQMV